MLRLKELREDHDLTQEEVGKILNVSQVAYSYYEIGKRLISIYDLDKLADFYNTSVDYLLYRTDNRKPYSKGLLKEDRTNKQKGPHLKV